jgi:serine protease Do
MIIKNYGKSILCDHHSGYLPDRRTPLGTLIANYPLKGDQRYGGLVRRMRRQRGGRLRRKDMYREIGTQQFTHRQKLILLSLVGIGMLLFGLISGAAMMAKGWPPFNRGWLPFNSGNRVPIYLASDQPINGQVTLNAGFSAVARAVTPAVVTIEISSRVRPQPYPFSGNPFMDPFWDFFRRSLPPGQDEEQMPRRSVPRQQAPPEGRGRLQPSGLGSGVIVSPDGYILTNNHVVEGAERVEVVLNDRRQFSAKTVGADPPSDVAVLKIDADQLPTLTLGDSNQAEVGDIVLAIGNPLGIGQTVTMGIISAKGRSTRAGSGSFEDFLQIDAAINRGNSGGALVNMRGELIGIPSQILSQTGGNIGIGFAIPTAMARYVMDHLIRGGKVQRGKLGITISPLTPDIAEQFGYKGASGALVQDVEAGQPADRAGVKPGDIITEFQGQRIDDDSQFRNLVAQTAPGTSVRFKVWRDGSERELTATLGELTAQAAGESRGGGGGSGAAGSALAGVRVQNLTPDIMRQLNLPPASRGVVISNVEIDSGAAGAGLRRGDVIEEINRQPVTSVNEFNAALQKAGRGSLLLRVRRAEGARYIVVRPQE